MNVPLPTHEEDRLAALYHYNILDTPAEQVFDDLTLLAAQLCDTPIALITFIDTDRQWFKSKIGLNLSETSREVSFCSYALLEPDEVLIVKDTLSDTRFMDNPFVTNDPKIRFYAGAPLVTEDGYALGTLCIIDHQPRELTPKQLAALQALSRAVMAEVQLRHQVALLTQTLAERDQAQKALQKTQAMLETKVEERTAELKAANEQLQLELAEREQTEQILAEERARLAQRVAERTAELSAANAELARTARAKDEFLASMSHELRTPLNAILGLTEALQEQTRGPLNDRQLKSLKTIEESGRHLLALINDILDLSKIEADKLELQFDLVPVETLCEASLQFIKQTALKKRIEILFKLDNHLALIRADTRRLKQILVNLLSNAVKFTPEEGQIGLEVSVEPERETIHFTVWDTGVGIAPEHLSQLFKPFMQIDSSLSRQYEGTGLGLALVYRLAELHKGSVSVTSIPERGSRFTLSLPWDSNLGSSRKAEPVAVALDTSIFQQVLVIEDSPVEVEHLTRYLNELNIQVVVYPQGKGAVTKVVELQPDLILLDLLLSGVSGWDVLKQLKEDPRTKDIPVIIISVVDEQSQGLALGAAGYLVKPISRQQLHAMLGQVAHQQTEARKALADAASPLILLAEDNEANIETLAAYLEDKGYRLVIARNGLEAIERAEEEAPALILMDIQMPKMDGLEAIYCIRAKAQLSNIPIIALTALAMSGDQERCLAAGANSYMSKPVSLKNLIRLIESHLEPVKG